MSFKIGDKVKVSAKNEDEEGRNFLMYSTIQGIANDLKGARKYIIGGSWIKTKLITKCTKEEASLYYNK